MPAITERKCNQLDRNILALPVRLGGLGLGNPSLEARREYASSVKVTKPLVEQIVCQSHQLPEDSLTKLAQQEVRGKRLKELEHRAERIKEMALRKTQRALDLATEKGSSAWLTVLPLQDLGFNLNIRGSSVMLRLTSGRYPLHMCLCLPLRLNRRSNKAQDARLDIHARGFWELHRSAYFDVRVCHPNAASYRDLEPQQIYRIHEGEKERLYSRRVLDIKHGTFTLLVFTTTGGMGTLFNFPLFI